MYQRSRIRNVTKAARNKAPLIVRHPTANLIGSHHSPNLPHPQDLARHTCDGSRMAGLLLSFKHKIRLAARRIQITKKYNGTDLDDGTMPTFESALQGFSQAYAETGSRQDPNGQHQRGVSEINRSSFALLVMSCAAQN